MQGDDGILVERKPASRAAPDTEERSRHGACRASVIEFRKNVRVSFRSVHRATIATPPPTSEKASGLIRLLLSVPSADR